MATKINTEAAIKGNFSAHDAFGSHARGNELPGRDLAELVRQGLQEQGFTPSRVIFEGPHFAFTCSSASLHFPIAVALHDPDVFNPIWSVSCSKKRGLVGRFFGKREEKELAAVAEAIHVTLVADQRVREVRWFDVLPDEPFRAERFSRTPRGLE